MDFIVILLLWEGGRILNRTPFKKLDSYYYRIIVPCRSDVGVLLREAEA